MLYVLQQEQRSKAVNVLEKKGMRSAVIEAVTAAAKEKPSIRKKEKQKIKKSSFTNHRNL